MTIVQMLERLNELYLGSFPDALAIATWESIYAAELEPGPDLQTAVMACAAKIGPRKKAPRPGEIAKHYPKLKLVSDKKYRFDSKEYFRLKWECLEWAEMQICKFYGNPDAIGEMRFGVQLSALSAPENEWLRIMNPEKAVDKYVKIKLRAEAGFASDEAVTFAKSRILPTLAQVEKARTIWPVVKLAREMTPAEMHAKVPGWKRLTG